METVAVLSTGNEIIQGNVTDTNSRFIASGLFRTDLRLVRVVIVGDDPAELSEGISGCAAKADCVIITGGLGPTEDDYTLEVLCGMTGCAPAVYEKGAARMEAFFSSMGMKPNPGDIKMVSVPDGAKVFENTTGLAAGYALTFHDTLIIAMPGVPGEMQPMFDNEVLPYLQTEYGVRVKRHLTFRSVMLRESEVNKRVKSLPLPFDDFEWGICTTPGMNTVTFVEKSGRPFPDVRIQEEVRRALGNTVLGEDLLEKEVVAILAAEGITLAAAESCTGGLVAERITSVPGASAVFSGGVVAYSNTAKADILGVRPETLEQFGAVSEETAAEMAEGVRRLFGADIGIATTGIAGPGGGTVGKPVGTVCFGFAVKGGTETFTRNIPGDRERVRRFTSQTILNKIRLYCTGN
ncbi:MAG TPA: CinA family nicotinamide mononucleotide deamidase-related protein [Spirochaetota bacterium]|nr:CinA family nicotinamide mononucleotide deamidase-related protein [Spirochaetota bacterium]HQP48252.1 CinA family nicotinamide mononucleotide deamidase-related protein [Spirochaetota bacterium]